MMVVGRRTPLGQLLQERREAAGYSRTRLGQVVGIPAGTIEGWEVGRVGKPPLADVLRVARFLRIEIEDVERAVLDGERPAEPRVPEPAEGAVPLLEQAIALFGWDVEQAADALGVTPAAVRAWRAGETAMALPELMTVAALLALDAAGLRAGTPTDARRALAQSRRPAAR